MIPYAPGRAAYAPSSLAKRRIAHFPARLHDDYELFAARQVGVILFWPKEFTFICGQCKQTMSEFRCLLD
jgi:hypothetical protein